MSKIASKIGKPSSIDLLITTEERLTSARIFVEIDASKELVWSVKMSLPNGKSRDRLVNYEHEPKFCATY